MSSETTHENLSDTLSLFRWFLAWRVDILTPLITITGFSEILLKDLSGTLAKPLTDDERRKFTGIILNRSKAIRRALDFFSLYVQVREGAFLKSVLWEKVSTKQIIEEVAKELQTEEIISKVLLNGNGEIPLIRSSPSELSLILAYLFMFTTVPVGKEREISIELKKFDGEFVSIEINTNSYDEYADISFLKKLVEQPSDLLLSKIVIELLDGKFELFIRDRILIYRLLLPIWLLPEKMDEVIRVDVKEQSVDSYLGQKIEIFNVIEQSGVDLLPTIRIVDFDHSIIGIVSESRNTVIFSGIKAGSTDLKMEYSSSNASEAILHILHVNVKPQTSNTL